MRVLLKVLFIVGFVSITANCVRLAYDVFFETGESVLDEYEAPVETQVKEVQTLSELAALYAEAHAAVKEHERDEGYRVLSWEEREERQDLEPFKSERVLKTAIEEWEDKSRKIQKLRFYWFVGLVLLLGGCILYRWQNEWIGIAALITAFSEMIFWTSPGYIFGSSQQFERLIENKLAFSSATLVLLLATGVWVKALTSKAGDGGR
ncbi:MAG: hypothetical protein OES32_09510 [Acidobacteriota bacterium]|nr:hypothetical protein [Acidobacteriota bacterium]